MEVERTCGMVFDDDAREYVIGRPDAPFSMTNYLGTQRMGAVISHNAGGYCWLDSPQVHRITRFRPNGVPMDFPGRYVYLRDEDSGKYWSPNWQPMGLPLDEAHYVCRHGLGYSTSPAITRASRRGSPCSSRATRTGATRWKSLMCASATRRTERGASACSAMWSSPSIISTWTTRTSR